VGKHKVCLGQLAEVRKRKWAHLLSGLAAVRFGGLDQVRTGSPGSGPPQTQNWTFGPVQPQCRILDRTWVQFTQGSGPDQSSEPNCDIPTYGFYNNAIELRNRLLHTRKKYPLESKQYQRALRSVLKRLYELVGQPVIKELRRLKIPEQSQIWWCLTSVFCSLPLHAMGPIPSNDCDGVSCYFSDLYIPSYTPTLSALLESRKPSELSSEKPSVLLVANPDGAMKHVWPEIWFIQGLDTKVTTLLGGTEKPLAVLEGLWDHWFVHFVCHRNLVAEKPFNAFFRLHEGNRLTLLNLIRSRLPTAEFAFLLTCHTAELTEGSIADEGLHLTAAVQYCGFRCVVGTM